MKAVSIEKTRLSDETYQRPAWFDQWAKRYILTWLEKITVGHLVIEDAGERYEFGEAGASLNGRVIVRHPSVYRDILLNGLVGAGEAYMRGYWESSNTVSVVRVFCANMLEIQKGDSFWAGVNKRLAGWAHRRFRVNNKQNSRLNIAAHYDLGNEFFQLFLDPTMMYSSAIFPNDQCTLNEAAVYKLDHICQRLQLSADDHLLEIGTGWGGMAIYAAQHYGCKVTTTTISREQYNYAVEQVRAAGLENQVTILMDDYRDLSCGIDNKFDKLVSIEMIEAVGHQYYQTYFETCSQLLKEGGLMLIQAITVPDQRYELTKNTPDFIQRYIFPGGELPSLSIIANHLTSHTDMQIVGVEDIALDYAKTLAAWRKNFFEHLDVVKTQGFDSTFIRMWDFYLSYCEGGFRERTISTVQLLMAKPRCQSLPVVST